MQAEPFLQRRALASEISCLGTVTKSLGWGVPNNALSTEEEFRGDLDLFVFFHTNIYYKITNHHPAITDPMLVIGTVSNIC